MIVFILELNIHKKLKNIIKITQEDTNVQEKKVKKKLKFSFL